MRIGPMTPIASLLPALLCACAITLAPSHADSQEGVEGCLICHGDPELEAEDGRVVGVSEEEYAESVHSGFACVDCHAGPGDYEEIPHYDEYTPVDCGACHWDVAELYNESVHSLSRLRGDIQAASCADCHGTHHVLAASDSTSPISRRGIPEMCGSCHGERAVVTPDYVRLPINLPNYLESVHGVRWRMGLETAVCTDCHGTHALKSARDEDSSVNRFRQATTCGRCHSQVASEYKNSIHGAALSLGITDAPTCTDCHEEHLIRGVEDPGSKSYPIRRAKELCGGCHTDPSLAARYGLPAGIVETYLDSYHGWALQRGSDLIANCTDCHNVHDIRSELDPTSSIHPDNVTATCARCHEGANPTFARSYTHETALQARGYHEWARLIYLVLISVVLGGMVLHNLVIVRYELWRHFSKRRRTAYIVRWKWAERVQHLVLLLSFTALALTGFALRYPDCWCARLIGLSQREELRADLHRAFAVMLISAIVYHLLWLALARRGRKSLREVAPRVSDFVQMVQNLSFYLGMRSRRPAFGGFDYTQKIEYWAVIWGTGIMAITGFVLWFPTFFTAWLPAWIVRVAEVVHFYEALLAVGAVVVWHFFYVIFMPEEYPMSTVWIDGRMPADIWKEGHRAQYERLGDGVLVHPTKRGEADGDSDKSAPGQNGGASGGSTLEDAAEGGRKA